MSFLNKQTLDKHIVPSLDDLICSASISAQLDGRKWPIRYDSIATAAIILDITSITFASICASVGYDLYQGMYVDFTKPLGLAALVSVLFCLGLNSQSLYTPTELLG